MFIMENADQEQYYASSQFSGSATANKFEVFLDFILYVLFFFFTEMALYDTCTCFHAS